jgi:hypothetical protein
MVLSLYLRSAPMPDSLVRDVKAGVRVLPDFLRPSWRCGYAKWGDSSRPGKWDTLQGLGWWERKRCRPQQLFQPAPPGRGFRANPLPASPPPAATASRSEVVAPRTRARSSVASPQPKSLIEGGVASIMPMKLKDIPALLVSARPLAPGTTPQPQLDRPTAPPAACPFQR